MHLSNRVKSRAAGETALNRHVFVGAILLWQYEVAWKVSSHKDCCMWREITNSDLRKSVPENHKVAGEWCLFDTWQSRAMEVVLNMEAGDAKLSQP